MTKRKASIALDEDDQSDRDPNGMVVGGEPPNTTANDNGISHSALSHNGSTSTIIVEGRTVKIQQSDNQNENSDSSSVGTNINLNSSSSTTNQQPNKGKKERADNWSSAEIQVLHRGIESRREIFYGPPSQATKKNRELAWEAITKEVNAVSTTPRTLSQVMKKFKNEKCRAKRKFVDPDKEGQSNNHLVGNTINVSNNLSNSNANSNGTSSATNDVSSNLRTSQQSSSHSAAISNNQHQQQQLQQQQQQQHQPHLMAAASTAVGTEGMTTPQATSINVVKLAPQNVAKTMIDLPGHTVQHTIQMPNDDMVLIVPPDMDGLLSGVNIVSDGNGHHHFQKCSNSALSNHQHSHHNQHAIQTLNSNQGLMNSTMSNGMMARTIPAASMCSLVYSTGNEVCATDHHIASSQSSITSNHIAVSAQNLVHHRNLNIDQSQQPHQLHHTSQAAHPQHQQQHSQQSQPQQQHPQQSQQQHPHQHPQHQSHHHLHQQQHPHSHGSHPQPIPHHQHLTQNHLASSTSTAAAAAISAGNPGGVAVESQLKNLLFNLLIKDGQHSSTIINSNHDDSKQRNDMLAIIASSLTKIESHLSRISKAAGTLFGPNSLLNENIGQAAGQPQQLVNPSAPANSSANGDNGSGGLIGASDNNNNNDSFDISNAGPNPTNE